jgi:hypothetical protein
MTRGLARNTASSATEWRAAPYGRVHVLARAYRATWRSLFASDPPVLTSLLRLDVLFVFAAEDVVGGL